MALFYQNEKVKKNKIKSSWSHRVLINILNYFLSSADNGGGVILVPLEFSLQSAWSILAPKRVNLRVILVCITVIDGIWNDECVVAQGSILGPLWSFKTSISFVRLEMWCHRWQWKVLPHPRMGLCKGKLWGMVEDAHSWCNSLRLPETILIPKEPDWCSASLFLMDL